MLASYNWLKELSGVDGSSAEYADSLTSLGLEIDKVVPYGEGLDRVVVAEVKNKVPHESRDKLTVVTVFDGTEEVQVVCGASNVPDPGGRVLFAQVGASLPNGMDIGERKLGGVLSRGMICSETELHIGADSDGIFVVSEEGFDAAPGTSAADALGLRDTIFEIGLTPNRPDALGHVGIARDLAVRAGQDFALPPISAPPSVLESAKGILADGDRLDLSTLWTGPVEVGTVEVRTVETDVLSKPVSVALSNPDRCPRYGAGVVLGVSIRPSPFWLRYRLYLLGLRPIHNVVDATNLVMLEYGCPIHAFDLAKVADRHIDVRLAREGEQMKTLDEVERELAADDLLICDGNGPVAVAGVMGGLESEISSSTEHVLIECAYFDPRSVRRTSRRLGLHTDASHRFERGVDPNGVPHVMARISALIGELSGGSVAGEALDVRRADIPEVVVPLRQHRVSMLLGFDTEDSEVERILRGLGCTVSATGNGTWSVTVPSFRPDLGREVDLIEEIARVRGFDRIPVDVPAVRTSREGTPFPVRFDRRLREAGALAGLHEAVTYAFCAPNDLANSRVSTHSVVVLNPLSEERSVMKTSLLPTLLHAARGAQRHQVDSIRLFEVATAFTHVEDVLPRETVVCAGMLLGQRPTWIGTEGDLDVFDAKGALQRLTAHAVGRPAELQLGEVPSYLHPKRAGIIGFRMGDRFEEVGVLGEVHPDVVEAMEMEGRPIYFEMDVAALRRIHQALGVPQAFDLPRYPSAARDISFIVDEELPSFRVMEAIREAGGSLVEAVELFDLYRGEHVPRGRKNLAFRVTYRDPESTLTDKVVDRAHRQVSAAVQKTFQAVIR
ncbi:MAG: phenylalanine--tRNA ligase subunit beta [Myxococcota bacterium]